MARPTKLYIYDKSSDIDRSQAAGRFSGDDDVLTLGIDKGIQQLQDALKELVKSKATFNRVLFQTHGSPGTIWFGNEAFDKKVLRTQFTGFGSLFPHPTRIYFDGCNVASAGPGTDFLLSAGYVFLTSRGGDTFGWTTIGHGLWGHIPLIGGHTLHFGGSNTFKRLRFWAGGEIDFPDSWIPGG